MNDVCVSKKRGHAQQVRFQVNYGSVGTCEGVTHFTGYDHLDEHTVVTHLFVDNAPVKQVEKGKKAIMVLDKTSFLCRIGWTGGGYR